MPFSPLSIGVYVQIVSRILFVFLITTSLADETHVHAVSAMQLGNVMFPISCSTKAQDSVEHGLAMFHSFLFDDSESRFKAAVEMDRSCAMAYWAEAMALYRPLAYSPSADDMKRAWELIQKATQLNATTQRERDYLKAAEILFRPDARNYAARNHEYSAQLEKICSTYPDDTEATVFYALSLLTLADSNHPIEDDKKAIAILNPVFASHPDHPGIAHCIIHAADNPQLAAEGLSAARKYAQIAPAAPHALHMPSHIFARLGLWQEDIDSNLASLQAAHNPSGVHVGAEHQLHAMESLEYAYLQTGSDDQAKAMVEESAKIAYEQADPSLHDYVNRTRANSPALYYLEMRNWKAAEALKPDSTSEPYNQAITFWAQAIAAGHLYHLAIAQNAAAQFDDMVELTKRSAKARIAQFMKTRQDEAHAWVLMLQGKDDESLLRLRKVADRQDLEGKDEIETPAREMLADMLMELNRPAEALAEYERSLKVDPNRFNGLYGAGEASALIGNLDEAKMHFAQLERNCATARSLRPELLHAREAAGRRDY